jgi:hypothetical protein
MSNTAKNALVTSDDFIVKLLGNVSCCWTPPQQKSGEQRGLKSDFIVRLCQSLSAQSMSILRDGCPIPDHPGPANGRFRPRSPPDGTANLHQRRNLPAKPLGTSPALALKSYLGVCAHANALAGFAIRAADNGQGSWIHRGCHADAGAWHRFEYGQLFQK